MLDTIIKGTGNSRTLRTVPNAMTLYSSWTEALQAMVDGSFPIDIGPLNLAGLLQKGNDLNKSTLLTDSTAALFGLGTGAVPDDALVKIAASISTIPVFKFGSYTGTGNGNGNENTAVKIYLPYEPSIFILCPPSTNATPLIRIKNGNGCGIYYKGDGSNSMNFFFAVWKSNYLAIYGGGNTPFPFNQSGVNHTYFYV